MNSLQELAAELDGHQITDDNGEISEQTLTEESAPSEETPVEESASPEKAEDQPQSQEDDPDELAEDDSGKRYVPENRFKKVYGEKKALEREIQKLKESNRPSKPNINEELNNIIAPKVDKADLIELKMTLPQFDPRPDEDGNPTNPDYSPELDSLGFEMLKANPGLTPLQAAQKALRLAKNLAKQEQQIKYEARQVKSIQSDQGITNRVTPRGGSSVNPDAMSDQELESYLRETGQW